MGSSALTERFVTGGRQPGPVAAAPPFATGAIPEARAPSSVLATLTPDSVLLGLILGSLWGVVGVEIWQDVRTGGLTAAGIAWGPCLHTAAGLLMCAATVMSARVLLRQRHHAASPPRSATRTSPSGPAEPVAFPDAAARCPESVPIEAGPAAAQIGIAHAERLQTLGQLAAGIAHDFNNILTAVHGGAALIGQNPGDAEAVRRFAGVILDAAYRGRSITRRLLCFARREDFRPQPVDPESLLEAVSEIADHTLGRLVSVNVEASAGLPPLMADQAQLETALVNLAINARDAMPSGGILTFAAAAESVSEIAAHPAGLRPGTYIRLSVGDTGSGIDRCVMPRVCEPFFTTKPAGEGTGLGLPMVKAFAEQSGGGLAIDSVPGRGTTVSLWLPAAGRPEPDLAAASPARRRILLVEEDPMVSETLAAVLDDAGFAVTAAASGAEALAVLRSPLRMDALVTDLSIPDTGGLKLIDEAQRVIRGLPAVLLTACPDQETQLAMRGAFSGKFSLLRKPVSLANLVDRIEALIADAPL